METAIIKKFIGKEDVKNISEVMNCTQSYVSKIRRGDRDTNSEVAKKVLSALEFAAEINMKKQEAFDLIKRGI